MSRSKLCAIIGIAITAAVLGTTASNAATRFGAKLTANTFPSNTGINPKFCDGTDDASLGKCTWISMRAFGRSAKAHRAPQDGTIGKIRLISCVPGSFKLQIARANADTGQGKVVREGPNIRYLGDPDQCDNDVQLIETFNVNVPVKKNDLLAIKTAKTGMLRCDSGGEKILMYVPPLVAGDGPEEADFDSGCFLLLEAEYK